MIECQLFRVRTFLYLLVILCLPISKILASDFCHDPKGTVQQRLQNPGWHFFRGGEGLEDFDTWPLLVAYRNLLYRSVFLPNVERSNETRSIPRQLADESGPVVEIYALEAPRDLWFSDPDILASVNEEAIKARSLLADWFRVPPLGAHQSSFFSRLAYETLADDVDRGVTPLVSIRWKDGSLGPLLLVIEQELRVGSSRTTRFQGFVSTPRIQNPWVLIFDHSAGIFRFETEDRSEAVGVQVVRRSDYRRFAQAREHYCSKRR